MKLKVQNVMDATILISQIIRECRPMPQKGKYRLARMHAKLLPEFNTINKQRDDMIKVYDHHPMVSAGGSKEDPLGQIMAPSAEFSVPEDKLEEFFAAWKEIGDGEIDVDVVPMPMSQFDLGDKINGSLEGNDILVLGQLVTELEI